MKRIITIVAIVVFIAALLFFFTYIRGRDADNVGFETVNPEDMPRQISEVLPNYRMKEKALVAKVNDEIYVVVTRGEKSTAGYEVEIDKLTLSEENGEKILTVYVEYTDPKPEDKFLYTKKELCNKVTVLLAGRASEEIFIGEVSTGASNDIKESTNIIYEIICSYGMGKSTQNTCIDERFFKYCLDTIKEEASDMANEAYERSLKIIQENEVTVRKIAEYLLKNETMNAEELDELMDDRKKKALI